MLSGPGPPPLPPPRLTRFATSRFTTRSPTLQPQTLFSRENRHFTTADPQNPHFATRLPMSKAYWDFVNGLGPSKAPNRPDISFYGAGALLALPVVGWWVGLLKTIFLMFSPIQTHKNNNNL